MSQRTKKLLVLAVDIDADIEVTNLSTPISGYEELLRAATIFAIKKPQDADVNVLFTTLSKAKMLEEKGYRAIPALVSGSKLGGTEALIKARTEVEQLVERYKPDGIVLVSDGSEDELLLPMLSSIAPVYGVERVIVEQHRGVEETYMLFARYLRKALEEPRFARIFLGIPGTVLIVVSIFALLGALREALLVGILVSGIFMVIRGFGLEDKIVSTVTETPVAIVSYTIAIASVAIGVGLVASQLLGGEQLTPPLLSSTLQVSNRIFGFAASIAILGHALSKFMSGSTQIGREVVALAAVIAAVAIVGKVAEALGSMESFNATEFATALIDVNFAPYAVASIVLVSIIWRLASYIDEALKHFK